MSKLSNNPRGVRVSKRGPSISRLVFLKTLEVLVLVNVILFLFFCAHFKVWPMAWSFTTLVFLSLFVFVFRDYSDTVSYVEELEGVLEDLQREHFLSKTTPSSSGDKDMD